MTTPTEPEPSAAPARPGFRRLLPVLALALVAVLMAGANGYVWYAVQRNAATETARQQGLAASRDAARLLFSYDYRSLAKDFSMGLSLTTGPFRQQYQDTTTKVVTDVAKKYHAVVQATVVQAGVVRADPSTVVTLVFVNQVTTSTRVTGQKVDLSRVRMTLDHVGGRWLVAKVEAL